MNPRHYRCRLNIVNWMRGQSYSFTTIPSLSHYAQGSFAKTCNKQTAITKNRATTIIEIAALKRSSPNNRLRKLPLCSCNDHMWDQYALLVNVAPKPYYLFRYSYFFIFLFFVIFLLQQKSLCFYLLNSMWTYLPQTSKIVACISFKEDQQLIKRPTELYACDQIRNEKETLINSLFFLI